MAILWEKIRKSILESVSVATEKTEEYTKFGKAKIDVLAVKRKISKQFTELGGIVYEAIKSKKTDEVLKSKEINEIVGSLKKLEKTLGEKEGVVDELKKKTESEEKEKKKK